MEHVGKRIKQHRLMKGLTQQELADLIHKGRPLISHIETHGKVNHDTFIKICKALNVEPEHLDSVTGESPGGYKSFSREDFLLLKAENDNLKNEILRLKDEIIEILKSNQGSPSGRSKNG